MANTSRQQSLLVAEDWQKLYQTFRNADFQAYDYETLRKAMIDYIKIYYPEDFNDFIESDEYIALIDLLAFFGQGLAFRNDLNARENAIDTAERRDSILKLAKLVSYSPKRASSAKGLLKIDSISSTESLIDSEGVNISNSSIIWNDPINPNWLEQFTIVLNAAMITTQKIGKPGNRATINNVRTDEYRLNISPVALPVYKFQSTVNNQSMNFEIVSASTVNDESIYEVSPINFSSFSILNRNDNLGNASNDTGWFFLFKQGALNSIDLSLTESLPNRIVNININNINNDDIWLYKLDSNGIPIEAWSSVPTVYGSNIAYNKLSSTNRKLFQVNTRSGDQIDLIFGDGVFADVPQGNFRLYYRTNNNLTYKINPVEVDSISFNIPYLSKNNRVETLSVVASLKYTVSNATARESVDNIRINAPQQYYTQNRMVTGEDYNILPFTKFNSVIKTKAVNRTSSGISRFLDVIDESGKYSSTNIFCQDGILYTEDKISSFTFDFNDESDINQVIDNNVTEILKSEELKHFYYKNYSRPTFIESGTITTSNASPAVVGVGTSFTAGDIGKPLFNLSGTLLGNITIVTDATHITLGANATTTLSNIGYRYEMNYWNNTTIDTNNNTGYFYNHDNVPLQLGDFTADTRRNVIKPGALIKFGAGAGKYFDINHQIQTGNVTQENEEEFIFAAIQNVVDEGNGQGLGDLSNGLGPVTINENLPTGAIVYDVIPPYNSNLDATLTETMLADILSFKDFGLGYEHDTQTWYSISSTNIDLTSDFSLTNAKDETNTNIDSSWLIRFETDGSIYKVYYRQKEYIFESELETRFYFDNTLKMFDPKTGEVIYDQIKLLKINTQPDSALMLYNSECLKIYDNIIESDGWENNKKIKVTFTDADLDGVPANPDFFDDFVNPDSGNKRVFYKLDDTDEFLSYLPVKVGNIVTTYATLSAINSNITKFIEGTVFYASTPDLFYQSQLVDDVLTAVDVSDSYVYKTGRQSIYFQYRHNSPNNRRIDPSPNNIIDLFILTKSYYDEFQKWILDSTGKITEPEMPSAEELRLEYSDLEDIKMVSDAIIYNSATFKLIFGSKAPTELRATFKVVKNPSINISDGEIKSRVVTALNNYFSIDNWDFGDTFYFTELSAYLHKVLSPTISSIIIVPTDTSKVFGEMFQITSDPNEIFVNAATVDNVEIISSITAKQLNQV